MKTILTVLLLSVLVGCSREAPSSGARYPRPYMPSNEDTNFLAAIRLFGETNQSMLIERTRSFSDASGTNYVIDVIRYDPPNHQFNATYEMVRSNCTWQVVKKLKETKTELPTR